MKDRLLTFLGFLLFLVSLPFLIVLLIVYIIPVVIVESIRESKVYKTEAKRYQLEQQVYNTMCSSCPNAKQCHDDCVTCDEYEEAMENENL